MAAPRTATYAPKSGPLAGRIFTGAPGTTQAYNAYQNARAQALGFSNYREEKQARRQIRYIFQQEQKGSRFGPIGKLRGQDKTEITRLLGEAMQQAGSNNMKDRRIGGPLDLFLQKIGRRNGAESWPVGETNR